MAKTKILPTKKVTRTLDAPPEQSTGTPSIPVKLTREYVTSGPAPNPVAAEIKQRVGQKYDDIEKYFGDPRLYEYMMRDPAISGSIRVLTYAVLSRGLSVLPRKAHDISKPIGEQPEAQRSAELAEEFEEMIRAMAVAPEIVIAEMMDALWDKVILAEMVWELDQPDGEDAEENEDARLVLKSLDPKPKQSWNFVVDSFGHTYGIAPTNSTAGSNGLVVINPEKFAILAWNVKRGDPRGTALLDSCYTPWEIRVQAWPEYFKFLKRAAGQRVVGELPPDAMSGPEFAVGSVTTLADVADMNPAEKMAYELARFDNATSIVIPNGAKVYTLESKLDGTSYKNGMDFLKREMVSAILLAARAVMEAEHGSKADSEGANDILGNILRFMRRWAVAPWEQIAYLWTLYNYGPQVARDDAPRVTLGEVDHQDQAALLTAFASVGYKVAESQLPELDVMAGIPVRQPGEKPIGSSQSDPNAVNDQNSEPDDPNAVDDAQNAKDGKAQKNKNE